MKLKDYFKEQKSLKINETDKFLLYEKVISNKNNKYFFNKINKFISIKSFAYGFMTIILIVGVYGIYFFNGNLSFEGFILKNYINQVNADYIAKIIDFNGDFYIKHEDNYYKTNKISNGDDIILKKGSEIIFEINTGTKGKLIGPAEFTLQKDSQEKYQILISKGDFIQLESTNQTNGIDIVLDDMTISSQKNINFLITKNDDEYQINNQGDKVVVQKNQKTREVNKQELLAIKENDITLIKNIKDFGQAIKIQGISQTFAIKEENTKKENQKITEMFIQEIITGQTNKNEKIDTELATNLGLIDGKKIPTEQQNKDLFRELENEDILKYLQGMYINKLKGNQNEYDKKQSFLQNRIYNIYKIFNIKNKSSSLITSVENLKTELSTSYHIPINHLDNLNTIKNRTTHINGIEFGSNTGNAEKLRNDLVTNLPASLVLK